MPGVPQTRRSGPCALRSVMRSRPPIRRSSSIVTSARTTSARREAAPRTARCAHRAPAPEPRLAHRLLLDQSESAMLNYNHLYYFHVAATEGSLSAAAAKLGVKQSTVSEQL